MIPDFLHLLLLLVPVCSSLRLLELHVPKLLDIRDEARLRCTFVLEGNRLFSVKWYKEEEEFFRFMPGSKPAVQTFFVPGVHIVRDRSNVSSLLLSPLEYRSTGLYRCEVSSEGPHFKVVFDQANMTVLGLPQEDPQIEGLERTYTLGSHVSSNCTSSPSYPAARVEWFIDSEKAQHWLLDYYYNGESLNPLGLETRTVGLKFLLDKSYVRIGKRSISLECSAIVGNITRTSQARINVAQLNNEKFTQSPSSSWTVLPQICVYVWLYYSIIYLCVGENIGAKLRTNTLL